MAQSWPSQSTASSPTLATPALSSKSGTAYVRTLRMRTRCWRPAFFSTLCNMRCLARALQPRASLIAL
eukprot:247195-Amphidinium_carterae.1